MARSVLASILTAMADDTYAPIVLVELNFDSGAVYFWNGLGDLVNDSKTYTGAGNLLSLVPSEETTDGTARGANISLSGVPSEMVSLALTEAFQGRTATIRIGHEGSADFSILFEGLMDSMDIEDSADSAVISLAVENESVILDRKVHRRYTDQSQKSRHSSDEFFSFANTTTEILQWGG